MSFLRRLFGSLGGLGGRKSPRSLEEQVRQLETRARSAPLGIRATLLNRAGDSCMRAGDHQRALGYFRQAIDLLLEDEQPEPARGVAKKIIRVHPQTVRTFCTLTWLDLATRQNAAAVRSLREYVKAVERRSDKDRAGAQIMAMARITSHEGFLKEASEALEELGFPTDADRVRTWLEEGGGPEAQGDPEEIRRHCLFSAITSTSPPKPDWSTA
jgi:hypothetical protein